MEYKKSYRGFVLWLLGFMAAAFSPLLLPTDDAGLLIRLVQNLTSIGLVILAWIILRTESVYWINGTTFEQARDAGSERRRAYASAHLRVFARFAAGYFLFSAFMQWRHFSYTIDIIVFTVGIIVTAVSTIRIKL